MKKLMLIPLAIIFISCAATIPVMVKLQVPSELDLPRIPGSLDCLAPETYKVLVKRDKLQTERRHTLRAIIETTHADR